MKKKPLPRDFFRLHPLHPNSSAIASCHSRTDEGRKTRELFIPCQRDGSRGDQTREMAERERERIAALRNAAALHLYMGWELSL